MTFELPGVREKEVSVSITGDVLTVKGERRFERDVEDAHQGKPYRDAAARQGEYEHFRAIGVRGELGG